MVSVLDRRDTMVPPDALLADVLPTERLTASGMAVPQVRADLRRIDDLRNAGTVVATWAQALGTIGVAVWIGHPLAYLAAFVLMGPAFARFASSVSCVGGVPNQAPAEWDDDNGHGTHTAGTIAAAANGIGIVGVAPNVRIAGVKVGDPDGFFFPEAVV